MKTNAAAKLAAFHTHQGAETIYLGPEVELQRTVMSCMLWEDIAYEGGESVAARIKRLVPLVRPQFAAGLAVTARNDMKLRHAPLLVVREMARTPTHKGLVAGTLQSIIQRPDDMTEFLSIYWLDGKQPLSAQVKRGLGKAFAKFSEYSLAKYDRDSVVKLRDVLFLSHAKPRDATVRYTKGERKAAKSPSSKVVWELKPHEQTYLRVAERSLPVPDTWEVALSAGADKKATFERLMREDMLGGLAFLRNLRNMHDAGVEKSEVANYMERVNLDRVLPFRFIAAARTCPQWEDVIERGMLRALERAPKLPGRTILVIDTSGSMRNRLSSKSEMTRLDVAASLAVLARELCEDVSIYCTAGDDHAQTHATMRAPARRGFALADFMAYDNTYKHIGGGGIFLTQCMDHIAGHEKQMPLRVIVLTDEVDCDKSRKPDKATILGAYNYIINISSHKHGIGFAKWTHIDGWSEAVLDYIRVYEAAQ